MAKFITRTFTTYAYGVFQINKKKLEQIDSIETAVPLKARELMAIEKEKNAKLMLMDTKQVTYAMDIQFFLDNASIVPDDDENNTEEEVNNG